MTKDRELGSTYLLGVPFESTIARRERLADNYDIDFGQERIFPELLAAVLEEVPEGADVLEVGAATGLATRPLLGRAGTVTAMEPSAGMLRRLLASDVADSPKLRTIKGLVEELPALPSFDAAVVTFTPRRGVALARLLTELGKRVRDRVVMMLDEDRSLDWAYLARGAAAQGFDVTLRIVSTADSRRHAVLLIARLHGAVVPEQGAEPEDEWAVDAREIAVPFPAPRGAATRLIRYFLAGGDRAVLVRTDPEGVDRLYGNLRTAVHRLGRSELTVRRDGDAVQVVRLPRAGDRERLSDADELP
ncbi:MAG: class I SAM-dependent methyltransferase [Coriobacteriia bacterium]